MSTKLLQPHLLNAFLNWKNEIEASCKLYIFTGEMNNPFIESVSDPISKLILLNIGGNAVKHLTMDDSGISFDCRVNGTPCSVFAEWWRVVGIWHENEGTVCNLLVNQVIVTTNQGLAVMDLAPPTGESVIAEADVGEPPAAVKPADVPRGKPTLTVVK